MSDSSTNMGGGCVTVGSVVAVIISAALNHSFGWGLLHFFCGWFYVIYAVLCRSHEIMPALRSMFS